MIGDFCAQTALDSMAVPDGRGCPGPGNELFLCAVRERSADGALLDVQVGSHLQRLLFERGESLFHLWDADHGGLRQDGGRAIHLQI